MLSFERISALSVREHLTGLADLQESTLLYSLLHALVSAIGGRSWFRASIAS